MYPRLAHFGSVNIPTFGAISALGLVLSLLFALRCARLAGVSEDGVWNLGLFTAFGTLVLSRLVLLAETPRAFMRYPLLILTLPTVTRFGVLLAAVSGVVYMVGKRMPPLRTMDAIAAPACLLGAFLHAGSIFAGDDLGTATASRLGKLIPGDEGHHPVALYGMFAALLICAISFVLLRSHQQAGQSFGVALSLSAIARFLVDEFRPLYVLSSTPADHLLRADQIILLLLVMAGGLLLLDRRSRDAK